MSDTSAKPAALVTGGSVRIGRAIAIALARAGYAVAVQARGPGADLDQVMAEIEGLGMPAAGLCADLGDPDGVQGLVHAAARAIGPLTLLVNNAAEFGTDTIEGLEIAQWDRHFAVNLRAPVFLAAAFARQAPAEADPCIVNITDQRARKPVPQQFSYTLTKCALHAATVVLAQALAPRVRVNAVAPGPTLPSPRQDAQAFARQAAALPLQRPARPDDIAAAVLYLATASQVTGETIAVDGGQHVAWKTPDVWGVEE